MKELRHGLEVGLKEFSIELEKNAYTQLQYVNYTQLRYPSLKESEVSDHFETRSKSVCALACVYVPACAWWVLREDACYLKKSDIDRVRLVDSYV